MDVETPHCSDKYIKGFFEQWWRNGSKVKQFGQLKTLSEIIREEKLSG
jgi:hypothetical protein